MHQLIATIILMTVMNTNIIFDFSHSSIEEIGFLIANSRAEDFKLLIDKIEIR
jgi:hypothetical protein